MQRQDDNDDNDDDDSDDDFQNGYVPPSMTRGYRDGENQDDNEQYKEKEDEENSLPIFHYN